ncbi:PREDICTED: guanine nucleotide exchange factor for Rab-3A-like [Polistes dominula]|uniref:Guanine nucleotide exchange factor for Rab-3A-like n=1 Tax=Polistes dominula TaxID=743375 RepID=A0ABM1ITP0_POLDO|nr:PREDICTED: guanine nucleotide exchange factor for Rab-3A-like [Polistes dominula]XP_015183578.1 PREDICTED: guanine nucleotide exchange factor for Rab-3A-like [Polistes dominula]XP_015183579.1 PREDICTED: guanine nucleotide exchange factor for Rab-3A-like [Polistes dominula]XP_015183581.1 PREDICTED: guanine nucleotide exchange factor for Rab-3A-like [Polistes dominula]XP_015183582.1 PREDICTED: guanine nucleotide exchange factor for Rab-3A-like [Polistes dominula]
MKAVQEQQQPESIESNESVSASSIEYAYRPLTTKHRRAGSTGTTGDEEYTTDEDELYPDEADCPIGSTLHAPHPILKSDLARAATDLFGYANKREGEEEEPTSLFDEDDKFLNNSSSLAKSNSLFVYNDKIHNVLTRHRSPTTMNEKKPSESILNTHAYKSDIQVPATQTMTNLDVRLGDEKIDDVMEEDTGINKWEEDICSASSSSDITSSRKKYEVDTRIKEEITITKDPIENPPSPTTAQWGRAVAEVKEHAVAKLQEELKRAHEELKLKDEEVARLSRIRQDVETELEELTASLFQEAHNMVREANVRQATAERLLEESRMKAEVLAAEVTALKTLVLTSTPARPNPHLHPQIDTRSRLCSNDESQQSLFAKKHRRSPSHFNLKYGRENSPPESPVKEQRPSLPSDRETLTRDWKKDREKDRDKDCKDLGLEVDPRVHTEFLRWKANPCVDKSDPFVARVFKEDIDLCLDFPNKELGSRVRQAVLDGIIFIEAVSDKTKLAFPKKCALLEAPRQCHYRMRLGDQENQWHCISQICRNRIIAVCDFLNYLRYVERGLVKSSVHDVYWEITRLRKEMVFARLGLVLSS